MSYQFEIDQQSCPQLTENDNTPHDPPCGLRDLLGRVRCFTRGKDDGLGTGVRKGSRNKCTVKGSVSGE